MSSSISVDDQSIYNTLESQRTVQKGRLIQLQTGALSGKKNKKKAELTLQELTDMRQTSGQNQNDIITYRAVGRMFIQSPMSTVLTDLESTIEQSEIDVSRLEKEAMYLTTEVTATEKQMQELIGAHAETLVQ